MCLDWDVNSIQIKISVNIIKIFTMFILGGVGKGVRDKGIKWKNSSVIGHYSSSAEVIENLASKGKSSNSCIIILLCPIQAQLFLVLFFLTKYEALYKTYCAWNFAFPDF